MTTAASPAGVQFLGDVAAYHRAAIVIVATRAASIAADHNVGH